MNSPELGRIRADILARDDQLLEDLTSLLELALVIELYGRESKSGLPIPDPHALWLPRLEAKAKSLGVDRGFIRNFVWHILHEWERLQKQHRNRLLGTPPETDDNLQLDIDSAIIYLDGIIDNIAGRFTDALKTEPIKRRLGRGIHDPDYEARRMTELRARAKEYGLDPEFVESLFKYIFAESRRLQIQRRERETAPIVE